MFRKTVDGNRADDLIHTGINVEVQRVNMIRYMLHAGKISMPKAIEKARLGRARQKLRVGAIDPPDSSAA
ncbi:MAG: hypothetical protein H8E30_14295 [Alphaproteobacteria bacterium]|nr:hypothetical protein [Alphaproteobacteria bacterium]